MIKCESNKVNLSDKTGTSDTKRSELLKYMPHVQTLFTSLFSDNDLSSIYPKKNVLLHKTNILLL